MPPSPKVVHFEMAEVVIKISIERKTLAFVEKDKPYLCKLLTEKKLEYHDLLVKILWGRKFFFAHVCSLNVHHLLCRPHRNIKSLQSYILQELIQVKVLPKLTLQAERNCVNELFMFFTSIHDFPLINWVAFDLHVDIIVIAWFILSIYPPFLIFS